MYPAASRRRLWRLIPPLLAAITALAWIAWPHLSRGYEGILTLLDLSGRPPPVLLDIRPIVVRHPVHYSASGQRRSGELYRSRGTLAGIVLVPGAAPLGKDDPRVVKFATVLARARFAVLVPDIPDLRALKLVPESAREIAAAFRHLLEHPELAPAGRAGLVTTSVAVGPALLAVADGALSKRVRFLVSIGGYFDLSRTLSYLTTGHYHAYGIALRRPPNHPGKWAYAMSNVERLQSREDRRALRALARRKLKDPGAGVEDLVARLGPDGRSIYDFVSNEDPGRSRALLARLPPAQQADLGALDLAARDLKDLRLRVILIHGIDDPIIPYGESLALAAALAPERVQLFLVRGLLHVDMAPDLTDGLRMWRAIDALLAERQAVAAP